MKICFQSFNYFYFKKTLYQIYSKIILHYIWTRNICTNHLKIVKNFLLFESFGTDSKIFQVVFTPVAINQLT